MLRKTWFVLILALSFIPCVYSYELLNTEQLTLGLDTYLRTDLVSFKNVVDLDSHNKDDHTTYLGIDYSFAFSADFKDSGNKFFLKLERIDRRRALNPHRHMPVIAYPTNSKVVLSLHVAVAQQRRDHARRSSHEDVGRGLGPGDGHQP